MERKGQNRDRDSDRGPQKMYKAKCSDCDQETEVPFEPDPERPVYCRECYAKRKSRQF